MRASRTKIAILGLAAAVAVALCALTAVSSALFPLVGRKQPVARTAIKPSPPGSLGPERRSAGGGRLDGIHARHLQRVRGLTHAGLQRLHSPPYLRQHDLDVVGARYHDGFVATFKLSAAARLTLRRLGFVVVPAPARRQPFRDKPTGAGPADVYYRVFAAHLPLFVSADSVLHAWHRTIDELLAETEEALLLEDLQQVISRTTDQLDGRDPAQRDALLYLAVARSYLDNKWRPTPRIEADVLRLRVAASTRLPLPVQWLGRTEVVDFSQFTPRGHYARTPRLARYFVAMSWLGRMELKLWNPARRAVPSPRQEAAARALAAAMGRGRALGAFDRIERFYLAYVGVANGLGPRDLLRLCAAAGQPDCRGPAGALHPFYATLTAPAYSGRFHVDDRRAVAMRLFPRRFSYGAWVMSRTTTPELEGGAARRDGRAMASPLDVAFALGADRALAHLAPEMRQPRRENLPAALEAARRTMHQVRPTKVADAVASHWLEALMALAKSHVDARHPRVLRTAAWHDRKLEAVLGSWTELRHDTVLAVDQSAGGVGCQYPAGYVEPVPELYRALGRAAARLEPLYASFEARKRARRGFRYEDQVLGTVPELMRHWQQTMKRLAGLAEAELAGRRMSARDLAFLNRTVDRHIEGYLGARLYDGWYPKLFWHRGWGSEMPGWMAGDAKLKGPIPQHYVAGQSKPITSDVHTDADRAQVLQLAVGHPGLMIVAVESGGEVALYGGPVYSFYASQRPLIQRLTDQQWRAQLDGPSPPARPGFTSAYWSR